MTGKLYKAIESGSLFEKLEWDIATPILNNNVCANDNFDVLVGKNQTRARKIIPMLNDFFKNQENSMFMSAIQLLDLKVKIE